MKTFELRDSEGATFAVVSKDEDKPWIYVQWLGKIKTNELRRVMIQYIDVLSTTRCPFVLSDRRKSSGNVIDISNFIEHKWASKAVEAGLQCVANVTAPSAISQITSLILSNRMLGFEFKSFQDIEDAEKWLMEKAATAQL